MSTAAMNVASQCRSTASDPLAKQISVDAGNGLLYELLLDAATELERQAKEIEALKADAVFDHSEYKRLRNGMAAEIEALKTDAERYRWLRDIRSDVCGTDEREEFDAEIDAAIAQQKETP